MISNNMYNVLALVPRAPGGTSYDRVINARTEGIDESTCHTLLGEAMSDCYGYVNLLLFDTTGVVQLTEKGQAAIDEYEQAEHNKKILEESLAVAKTAKIVAIASAIAAFITLLVTALPLITSLLQKCSK